MLPKLRLPDRKSSSPASSNNRPPQNGRLRRQRRNPAGSSCCDAHAVVTNPPDDVDYMNEARTRWADAGLTRLRQKHSNGSVLPFWMSAMLTARCRPDSLNVPAEVVRGTCLRFLMVACWACWPNEPTDSPLDPAKSPAALSVVASWPITMFVKVASPFRSSIWISSFSATTGFLGSWPASMTRLIGSLGSRTDWQRP